MKKKLLIGFSVVSICAAFWACGTGDIETVGMGDENARDLYGFDPDAMDQLVADAKKNCADDPKCVAAQENAEPIGSDDEGDEDNPGDEEDSSASSSPSSSGTTAGSSGAVAGSSAATGTSSAATGTSSATTGTSSATTGSSSSTAKSSSSVYIDPTGTIGGGCKAKKTSIDKGGSTQWYYNRIGTVIPGKYEWTLTGGDITTSTDSLTPAVTYAKAGVYKATLTLNKGMSNEKTITCADSVIVKGEPVKNCVCTNDAKGTVFFKSGSPASVKWSVSGCTGGSTFTYAWGGAATGTEASATASISTAGSVAPTLVVTNEEQGNMTVSCPAVTAEQLLSATCGVGPHDYDASSNTLSVLPGKSFYFKPQNVSMADNNATATLDLKGSDGTTKQVTTKSGGNSTAVSLTAPTKLGTYTYTLSASGIEVCKATLKVEYSSIKGTCTPSSTSPLMGDNVTFSVSGQSWSRSDYGASLTMDIEGAGAEKTTTVSLDYNAPNGFSFKAPTTSGSKTVKLTYKGNEFCSMALNVKKPSITATCAISSSSVVPGEPAKLTISKVSSDWRTDLYGESLPMKFTKGDGTTIDTTIAKSSSSISFVPPSTPGKYTYKLTYGGDQFCSATVTVNQLSATCEDLTAYTRQSLSKPVALSGLTSYGIPLKITVNGDSVGGNKSCTSGCSYSLNAPSSAGTYKYQVHMQGNQVCEGNLTVKDPLSCSPATKTIDEGESFTFTTDYGGGTGCSSASTTENGETYSSKCTQEQIITPKKAGTFTYKYSAKGAYGDGECSATVTVNAVAPTCAVGNQTRIYIGSKVDIAPTKVTGCLNDADGCDYSIILAGAEKISGSTYAGGKLPQQLSGETALGPTNYTLSLTNKAGTGTCDFTVAYTDTVFVNVTTTFQSYTAGKKYLITTPSSFNNGPSNFKCNSNNSMGNNSAPAGTLTKVGSTSGTSATISSQWSPANFGSLSPSSEYIFVPDSNAPSTMTCGLQW